VPSNFQFVWAQGTADQPDMLLRWVESLEAGQARLEEGQKAIRREVYHLACRHELMEVYILWGSVVLNHAQGLARSC
jgi:hypothetical protein